MVRAAMPFNLCCRRSAVLSNPAADSSRVAGTRHGLERQVSKVGAILWCYRPLAEVESSSLFVRECRKLIFEQLDAGRHRRDIDARRVAASMTPARADALKPASLLQVVDALDSACASAPSFTCLASTARDVLLMAREEVETAVLQAPAQAAPHSSPDKRHSTRRRRLDSEASRFSPHFSPHLQPASEGSVSEQLLTLFRSLCEKSLVHLQRGKSLAEQLEFIDDELHRLHDYTCRRADELQAQLLRAQQMNERWRAPNVRAELRSMARIVKEHFEPLANRSAERPVDKLALLADLKKGSPTAFMVLKLLSTSGRDSIHSAKGQQKLIDGLVPFSIFAGQSAPSTAYTLDWRGASLHPPTTPRQPDAVSCGVHMLVGIWCCMSDVPLASRLDGSLRSVNYWRDVITLCLYRGGL